MTALDKISKTAGQAVKAGKAGAKIGGLGAGSAGALANLTTIGATLALTKATTDVFDARIEAEARGQQMQLDAVNTSMFRLYDKHQGDIGAINVDLQNQGAMIRNSAAQYDVLRGDVQDLDNQTSDFSRG